MRAPSALELRTQIGAPLHAPGDSEVVLRDPDGAPCAYGSKDEADYHIHFPGVADFRFRPGGHEVVAHARAATEVVEDLFRTTVVPLALQASGYEALHASAVQVETGIAALCGYSGSGKSTVAYGLSRRGYPLWGDDAVVFDVAEDRRIRCFPIPFALQLRDASRRYFTASGEDVADAPSASAELAVVVVLDRVVGRVLRLERVSIANAMRALLPHAYRFTLADPSRARRTIESYLDVIAQVPVFRARYSPGFSELPALLDAIESMVTSVPEPT